MRIGVDLGGTKIEIAVLDDAGHVALRQRIATEAEGGVDHIVSRIGSLYRSSLDAVQGRAHTIGIGTPGAVSRRTGLLKNSNTVCLNGQPLAQLIEACLGHAVRVENDANCFALAETLLGAGRGCDPGLVFGVILGTGCGGGIVIDGRLRRGPQALAGEWGHMSLDPAGLPCYCGQRGCVETLLSGSGLERRFHASTGRSCSAAEIFTLAEGGDAQADALLGTWHAAFGRALANVIDVLDPDLIVLGGGLSNVDSLYVAGVDAVRQSVFSDELTTPIVRHALGDSAGVLGAALLGAEA